MTEVMELVVYQLKDNCEIAYRQLRPELERQLSELAGFISLTTYTEWRNGSQYVDICRWDNAENAAQAYLDFKKLEVATPFMALLAGKPKFKGHFEAMQGTSAP